MDRIAIAASKISQGNLLLYNVCVLLLSFLISVLLFLLAGTTIFFGLWIIRLLVGPFVPSMSQAIWNEVFSYSLIALTFLIGCINIFAVIKNIKIKK